MSNIIAYSIGGSVGFIIFSCIVIVWCIFCCRRYCKSNSPGSTTVYTAPPRVNTVHCAPAKENSPPPKYTGRPVATTGAGNCSCTAVHMVELMQSETSNGLVCQKEQTKEFLYT